MRDPARIEPLLRTIKTLWLKRPDLRFGQIIVNALNPKDCSEVFNIEDDAFQSCLDIDLYGAAGSPSAEASIGFGKLWTGDRFRSGETLWTKVGADVARQHCPRSVSLGELGYGYIGDAICSFEREDLVFFVPPV